MFDVLQSDSLHQSLLAPLEGNVVVEMLPIVVSEQSCLDILQMGTLFHNLH